MTKRDGTTVRGQVVRSDHEAVDIDGAVQRADDPPTRERHRIERRDIAEVDHPGDGLIVGGTALGLAAAGLGVLGVTELAQANDSGGGGFGGNWSDFHRTAGIVSLGLGISAAVGSVFLLERGFSQKAESEERLECSNPYLRPSLAIDQHGAAAGVQGSF